MYQESYSARFWNWVGRILSRLFRAGSALPGGWWSSVALIAALVLVVAAVVFWIRPASARRARPGALLTGATLTAQDHRDLAARHAAAGDYGAAIVERMRAIAVSIEERGILPARPGRTADELAAQAGRALPALADLLAAAARLFDDVLYGGRDGTMTGYERLRELDDAVLAGRRAGQAAAVGGAAGPA
jgi:Domain of unknown function (DUF4129)